MMMELFKEPKPQNKDNLEVVCVQDFDDEYHKDLYDPDDKLMNSVRMIRRRYKSTLEYQYAINLLNNYIARLMIKYGGEDRFVRMLRAGLIDEYLPPFPRMKAGGKNKFLVKNKIILSNASFKRLDIDRLMELTDIYSGDSELSKLVFTEKDDKDVSKVNDLIEKNNVDKVTPTYAKRLSIDMFEEYFISKRGKQEKRQEEFLSDITVRDVLENPEDIIDASSEDEDDYVQYRGGFIHKNEVETIKSISKLGQLGWDQLKLTRRIKGSKNILALTKHQTKKEKKNAKKRQKAGDSFLLKLAGESDNHSSFADFEDAMLNFTSEQWKS